LTVERLTPERRRELTREALLDAASEVFARRGYDGGTLEEIAAAAGFTTGAIYSNFGGKQDLFLAVLDERNARFTDHYIAQLAEQPRRALPELGEIATLWSQIELANDDALRLTLEYRLAALRDPQMRKKVAKYERATDEAITEFVRARLDERAGSVDLSIPVEDFAVIVRAATQGIHQHLAVCGSDHSNLFDNFLALLSRCLEPLA
jgi:AcrR family transcriptional regulator